MKDTTSLRDRLLEAALAARSRAYAPYSGYPVGAALVTPSGSIHAGCNVENAAFPVGTCAEAGAIASMVAAGETRIMEVVVVGSGPDPATPCGACRQRLGEFGAADVLVHAADEDGIRLSLTLGELLPHAFGPKHLKT